MIKNNAEFVAAEKKKHDMLASILVETDKTESSATEKDTTDGKVADEKLVKSEDSRHRVNESPWRLHLGKLFLDNFVTPTAKRVACLLCQKQF